MAASLHAQPHEITTRLHSLGVTEEQLHEAVAKGLDARNRCTGFHPPSAPGYYQWSEIHVGLRQALVKLRWTPDDTGGFSTVVSPDGLVAITVATGSNRTGRAGLPEPTTKYPRGAMTHAAVETNHQLALDLQTGASIVPSETEIKKPKCVTWWLLVHTRHDEVRLELSCPRAVGEDGRIDSWSERIILEPLGIEPTMSIVPEDEEPEMQPIDVRVERR